MKVFNDIKALSKIAVKLDSEYENTNQKHTKKLKRILKRALMIERRLLMAFGQLFPIKTDKDLKDMIRNQLTWMNDRMQNRTGRITRRKV